MALNYRLGGVDVRRTNTLEAYLTKDWPRTLREELQDNKSLLWRAIYRAGLDALEAMRATGAAPPSVDVGETIAEQKGGPEATVTQSAAAQGLTKGTQGLLESDLQSEEDKAAEERRKARGRGRKPKS